MNENKEAATRKNLSVLLIQMCGSKENEFPWELFWALFFSSCIEKQRRATRRDTKNSKVLLRTNKQQGSSVALSLTLDLDKCCLKPLLP